MRSNTLLPLPRWVLHPYTALVLAGVHLYLAWGHLLPLFGGDIQWTHTWKGFGALGGAYAFAALALGGPARREGRHLWAGTPPQGSAEARADG